MDYPRIAVSTIVKRAERYLLVLRASGQASGYYAFPGGKVEAGETLSQAALRELQEETGICGENPRFFRLYDLISHNTNGSVESHYVLAVHLVDADNGQEAIAADDAADAGWYSASEALSLPVPPSVRECIDYLEANGPVAQLRALTMEA
ncbi:NUDIX hydrolase [Hoeflea prorocentri]|uniref:NUDIX domain-containing protein n=1 Tax=Hoeflea prorocentri TaxID=1922333 RepID=A0A9X3UIU9_9HYPH|nr:NUDIX domain-containing protein [Hoeflea prorocentri]MCY6381442.1 NUDIX domain-containing protein [Hoeflea prorocentri]MDA5399242.1 NUDIX domain-containing protein [Hoeflea prorocentri]